MSLRWLAFLVLLAAIGLGTWLDPRPPKKPIAIDGKVLLRVEMHAHTRFSDGFLSPFDVVDQARRRGLDAIAITEHNVVFPAKLAREYGRRVGMTVIVGEEITTHEYHLLAYGLDRAVSARLPIRDAIGEVHAQGGLVVAAHPTKRFWPGLEPAIDLLDGVEVVHPIALRDAPGFGRHDDIVSFYDRVRADHPITAVASSDYHFGSPLGILATYVLATENSEKAILQALHDGHTVVFDPRGRAYGDPSLIAALDGRPPEPPDADYGYRGASVLDVFVRTLGFVAMLGLVVLPAARRAKKKAGA